MSAANLDHLEAKLDPEVLSQIAAARWRAGREMDVRASPDAKRTRAT